ncbi:hypothetical protein K525DRAFT_284599 [Schizophyllum commune Loenen D]|nr:hypothetical protein K525DRAFT_284599 [Schizophyllum commune Loenen D]
MLDFNEAQATAVIRRRLQAQSLSDHDIQERIASYLLAVSRLLRGAQVAYDLMDDDDPRRVGLATCCASQIQTWLDEIAGPEPDYATEQCSTTPSMLPRGRRHFLEEYFKLNAYPSVADKKVLAQHERATYKQIHTWFQNRRARAKATNAPLKKCAQSPAVSAAVFDQARLAAESHDHLSDDEVVKNETWDDMIDEAPLAWAQQPSPEPVETPRARLQAEFRTSMAASTPSTAHRRSSRAAKAVDMDQLISAFDAMNVRGAGTKTVIGAEKGYAARQAITYVAPKAPLPSYIPQEQPAPRKLVGLPKRQPAARRRLISSSESDRVPSLTYSDSSDSSSSPSPEPPTRSELLPSPPSPTWVDLPSPSFPLIVTPPGGIACDTSSSHTWREDAGAEGDDEDETWDRASKRASLAPSKPRRKTSKQKTAKPQSKSARSPAPAPQPTLPIASDEIDGAERLPGWDELDFLNLDVDPATAGALDIHLGSWDGVNATQPALQLDFAPVAEVQNEPVKQTVDESYASTGLAAGWNDASSLVAVDNLTFDNDFAPSAFDGFIASNWNLEPELEPASNPSTLFGKTGFEANSSKPTFGSSVPKTTFTFGFGASTAAATAFAAPASAPSASSSTLKPTMPSSSFTFGKPAASQPTTQNASISSPFTFGTPSTSTSAFSASSTLRASTPAPPTSSSCAPSSSFAFGAGSPGVFTFGIAG